MDREKDLREDVQEELYEEEEEVYGEEETQEETSRAQRKPNDPLQLVIRCVEEMIDYVENAKRVFFLQGVLVDRDLMVENLRQVKEKLPEAMMEAQQVLKERDRILQETNEYAVNTTRDADNKANQTRINAANEANRVMGEANAYYAQHKDEGDAYIQQCRDEGDAYVKQSKQQGDTYVNDQKAWAENYVRAKMQEAERELERRVSMENVMQTAQAQAQALKNQTEIECNSCLAKASEDANALFGAAATQAQQLLRDLNQFQKQQNQALQAYCEEFEKHLREPQAGRKA